MQTRTTNNSSIRFRRFTRRAYAVFASLHREVTIGTLQGSAINSQLRKSGLAQVVLHINKGEIDNESLICDADEELANLTNSQLLTTTILSQTDAAAASASSILSHIESNDNKKSVIVALLLCRYKRNLHIKRRFTNSQN